jgi:hypothetical protein
MSTALTARPSTGPASTAPPSCWCVFWKWVGAGGGASRGWSKHHQGLCSRPSLSRGPKLSTRLNMHNTSTPSPQKGNVTGRGEICVTRDAFVKVRAACLGDGGGKKKQFCTAQALPWASWPWAPRHTARNTTNQQTPNMQTNKTQGDIIFEGTVKANRTLCNWGARDIKPLPPPPAPPSGQPGAAGVEEEAL